MEPFPIRVLLVEDDEDDYLLTRELLAEVGTQRFILDWVTTYAQALEWMIQNRHDVYLLDYRLGEHNGLELLQEAKRQGCEGPIILLTGQGSYAVDMAGMQAGAADYLVKGQINASLLERSIRYAIERKRAEEERQRLQKQLCHVQKMESIRRLASGIAHDFNNVLTMIMNAVGLLQIRVGNNPQILPYLNIVSSAALRGADIARQLFLFAPLDELKLSPLSLTQVIRNGCRLLAHSLPRSITLQTEIPPHDIMIQGHREYLQQVLLHLVQNAQEAMPAGGVLTVRLTTVPAEAIRPFPPDLPAAPGYAVLSLTDTGVGMDAETQQRAFEPFFSTKPRE
ncbi:MAG: response regulator, partial [Nitrospinota bacterium]